MAVPEVDKQMLRELESMGFPTARAIRVLHFSGNCSIEDALNWFFEHEGEPDIDQIPLVPINITIESGTSWMVPDNVNIKLQELRERVNKRKLDEEMKLQREREKERRRAAKELLEASQIMEENERKRILLLRKAEKEEEKRARERIRRQIENDKAERRHKLGSKPAALGTAESTTPFVQEKKKPASFRPASKAECMRDCLRSLKKNHKDEDVKVKRAFGTLLTYVCNVAKNPNEEKYRKIRLGNPNFQERVGNLRGGTEFLELCGFEKVEGNTYMYLPRDKVDMTILSIAASELNYAMTNPFFGLL